MAPFLILDRMARPNRTFSSAGNGESRPGVMYEAKRMQFSVLATPPIIVIIKVVKIVRLRPRRCP